MCSTQICILVLFSISSVLCKNEPCDLNDDKCMTESASRKFLVVISGMPGVESSDPLHLDFFEVNLPKLKFMMTNASLSGLKKCHMELVHFSPKERYYNAYYGCPHLILQSEYELNGYVGPEFVEGKGTCKVDYYDYNLHFYGDYDRNVLDDGKKHIHLNHNKLEIDAKGKIHYDFTNLFDGDKEKSDAAHKLTNENWQYIDKLTSQKLMELFMTKHIENVNAFFRKIPVQDIFTH